MPRRTIFSNIDKSNPSRISGSTYWKADAGAMGHGRYGFFYVDSSEAVKSFNILDHQIKLYSGIGVAQATIELKKEMLKSFFKASLGGKPNTISTTLFKIMRGYIAGGIPQPLIETGSLLHQLMNAKADFSYISRGEKSHQIRGEYSFTPPEAGQHVAFPEFNQVRKDSGHQYIWSQEFGTKRPVHAFGLYQRKRITIPPRPFFREGLKKGIMRSMAAIRGQIFIAIEKSKKLERTPLIGLNIEREFKWSSFDMGMMMLPPSSIYSKIGAGFDVSGFMQGSFSEIQIDRWTTSFAKGQSGATKKVQRRKMRRRLWA